MVDHLKTSMNLRNNQFYIDNEVRFYITLRRRQVIGNVESASSITNDEICNADLRNLYTKDNPGWVEAWQKREKARQDHKKVLDQIEAEAIKIL